MALYPITFSIPSEKIVTTIPKKSYIVAKFIPVGVGEKTYIYNTEEEYYNDYKQSLFAITKKKGGWDCMRHYEILACGCIPYFENFKECPKYRLFNFPKKIILEVNKFYNYLTSKYNISLNNSASQLTNDEINMCYNYINILLEYTKNYLTTKSIGKYIIDKTQISVNDNILYIYNHKGEDYLGCLTLHGLKEIFGKNCDDYPFFPYIYKECDETKNFNYNSLHGRGFTYTKLLEKNDYNNNYTDEKIIENIKNNKYSLIIYSSLHCEKSIYNKHIFIDIVNKYYPNDKVVFLCGEDEHKPDHKTSKCLYPEYIRKGYKCFVREL
jgi:hypothetical protein